MADKNLKEKLKSPSIKELFLNLSWPPDKQRERLEQLFVYLGQVDKDIPALEELISSDPSFQRLMLKTLVELAHILDLYEDREYEKKLKMKRFDFSGMLHECKICPCLLAILSSRPKNWLSTTIIHSGLPWRSCYFLSILVLSYVVDMLAPFGREKKSEGVLSPLIQYNTIETLLKHVESDRCLFTTCAAVHTIRQLAEMSNGARERIVFNGGIGALKQFIPRFHTTRLFQSKVDPGLSEWEEWLLYSKSFGFDIHMHPVDWPELMEKSNYQTTFNGNRWGRNLQVHAIEALAYCASPEFTLKHLLMEDTHLMKMIQSYIRTFPVSIEDCEVFKSCLLLVANLSSDYKCACLLLKDYHIGKYLDYHIYIGDYEMLDRCLMVVQSMVRHKGIPRNRMCCSEDILRVLILNTQSFERKLQTKATECLMHMSDSRFADRLLDSQYNFKCLIILKDYFDMTPPVCCHLVQTVKNFKASIPELWKQQEASVSDLKYDYNYSEAARMYDVSNKLFQNEMVSDSLRGYDRAILHMPPSFKYLDMEQPKAAIWDLEDHNCDKMKELCKEANTWWHMFLAWPNANMAIAFMRKKMWRHAVRSCDVAIARALYSGNTVMAYQSGDTMCDLAGEIRDVLFRCTSRRSEALSDLGLTKRAMGDCCLIRVMGRGHSDTEHARANFLQVFETFRKKYGADLLRICRWCLNGSEYGLKRCGGKDCYDFYCSKSCQIKMWTDGHKQECPGVLSKQGEFVDDSNFEENPAIQQVCNQS